MDKRGTKPLIAGAESGSLSDRVFEQLENSILNGSIQQGESLNELKLSAELGVSRTPVREAIRMLEQKNLVSLTPNKGAVVLGVDHKDLQDIYTIRSYIEGLASRWAAENITADKCKRLREIVDLQEFYYLKSDSDQISEMDSRFHETIFNYSESRSLEHMLRDLHHMIQRYRKLSIEEAERTEKSIAEHRLILEAICNGDGDEAERQTATHINNAKENLLRLFAGEAK
ncbi:MAG: GntR family transcriptional regulator [Clostridiales bacterium]|nr:GntR family transcriptional regulator [Clostridiales bacterium]MCL2166830.1 GntR family transcriptional regulator [Clostridiales bacterium]